jgi:hypothetical protein
MTRLRLRTALNNMLRRAKAVPRMGPILQLGAANVVIRRSGADTADVCRFQELLTKTQRER